MLEIHSKYQAIFFTNASDIVPSPEIISNVLTMFRDMELLPSTFQELSGNSVAMQPRIQLNNSNNEWVILFGSNRILIEKNPTPPSSRNMGEIEDFVGQAVDILLRISSHFKLKGNRLSLISSGMFEQMSGELLGQIQTKLFNNIPFYNREPPNEWNYRNASRWHGLKINDITEPLNVISSINRVRGQFNEPIGVTPFDRIEISFDINTESDNTDNRFSGDSLNEFFMYVIKLRNEIIAQIEGVIRG